MMFQSPEVLLGCPSAKASVWSAGAFGVLFVGLMRMTQLKAKGDEQAYSELQAEVERLFGLGKA